MRVTLVDWLRRPWVWAVVAVAILGVSAGLLRYAPVFRVDHVTVKGNQQVTDDQVRAVAGIGDRSPLVGLPVEEIADRIETLDAVASAEVTRDWPDTVSIAVRERRPVGYADVGSSVLLVGSDGTLYREQPSAPRDLPQLPAVGGALGDSYPSDSAALTVAQALPRPLQRDVQEISGSDDEVQLVVGASVTVDWGAAVANERKVDVLRLLQQRRDWGRTFTEVDLSVPDAPALRGTPAG